MKKNKIITASMVALLSVSTLGAGTAAFATNGRIDDENGATTTTIEFTDSKGHEIKPTAPINPDESVRPDAPLSLIWVTDKINFGSHVAKAGQTEFPGLKGASDSEYDAEGKLVDPSNPMDKFQMEVLDTRAVPSGWTVSGEFSTKDEANQDVSGIELSFPAAEKKISGVKAEGKLTAGGVVFSGNNTKADFFKGTKDATGASVIQSDVKNIKMTVPLENQTAGKTFTSTIKWTLTADSTTAQP